MRAIAGLMTLAGAVTTTTAAASRTAPTTAARAAPRRWGSPRTPAARSASTSGT